MDEMTKTKQWAQFWRIEMKKSARLMFPSPSLIKALSLAAVLTLALAPRTAAQERIGSLYLQPMTDPITDADNSVALTLNGARSRSLGWKCVGAELHVAMTFDKYL